MGTKSRWGFPVSECRKVRCINRDRCDECVCNRGEYTQEDKDNGKTNPLDVAV